MASAAQIEANRLNAVLSCDPKSSDGKTRSSSNHLKFGLFSTQNCVRPEETAEYNKQSKALWKGLNPVGPIEEMLAVEIVRAAWRLHRCAVAEADNGEDPDTQASVDRARASAHNSMRRFLNDLRQFQSDRWLRAEVLRAGFDEAYIGIADAHRVIKGLADNERLKARFLMAPIGIDPLNQTVGQASRPVERPPAPTIRTQSPPVSSPSRDRRESATDDREGAVPQPVAQMPSVPPAVFAAAAIRTQSVPSGAGLQPAPGFSPAPPAGPTLAIPRNAPCPCQSGLKYKRCCGAAAPPVLSAPPARTHEAMGLP